MSARGTVETVDLDQDHVAGTLGNIGLFIWRARTLATTVSAGTDMMRELGSRFPQGLGLVQVVEPSATAPDADARKALAHLLESGRGAIKCSSVIYEITGFKGAAMRSVVTTLNLVARPDFPHRVFASTAEALDWQAPLLPAVDGSAWSAAVIADAIAELRTRLDASAMG